MVPRPIAGMRAPLASMVCIDAPQKYGTSSFRLLENLPADQHAADFVGSGADLVEFGVAQQPPGRKLVDVAIAAQALDRLERHPSGLFGGEQDCAGGVLPRRLAAITRAR